MFFINNIFASNTKRAAKLHLFFEKAMSYIYYFCFSRETGCYPTLHLRRGVRSPRPKHYVPNLAKQLLRDLSAEFFDN